LLWEQTLMSKMVSEEVVERFWNKIQEDGDDFDFDQCRELLKQFADWIVEGCAQEVARIEIQWGGSISEQVRDLKS
jgi:hypothetical protein